MKLFVGSLLRSVFGSTSADDFCKHLVLSVFSGFGIRGAVICEIASESRLAVVGSYGSTGALAGNGLTIWSEEPIGQAIATNNVIYCPPPPEKFRTGAGYREYG